MKICDATTDCIGFNTNGWLKKSCPNQEVMRDVNTYLDATSMCFVFSCYAVYVPSGEEPDVLLWPMPSDYHSGESVSTIDPLNLRFHSNFQSDELTAAISR